MTDKSHDPNQMTGAAMIVRALIDHGVQHVFGYPGGVPGYDGDKQFGNNVAHETTQSSQRLREHSGQSLNVKARQALSRFPYCTEVPLVRRVFLRRRTRMADGRAGSLPGSPDGAQRNPGQPPRGGAGPPDCAALHPGYGVCSRSHLPAESGSTQANSGS